MKHHLSISISFWKKKLSHLNQNIILTFKKGCLKGNVRIENFSFLQKLEIFIF